MEAAGARRNPAGRHSRRLWQLFKLLIRLFGRVLKLAGLYQRGLRNALDIRLTRLDLAFPELPAAFDGFTILQLTDLHVDALPGAMAAARARAAEVEVDLCVLTGDYRFRVDGPYQQILPGMRDLLAAVRARRGVCAVLGNHDCADMVPAFEALGIAMLVNQTLSLEQDGAAIHLTGTDDVHYFYGEAARGALRAAPDGFKIALIHSPELADAAAESGFQLYLTGHTHGGQVCLPGGHPILTHLSRHRRYARGLWRHGGMRGYTSTGVGISALPVRFNNRGEVVLITLRRAGI
jgi:predicted MPP superfamily phosphohydrolase